MDGILSGFGLASAAGLNAYIPLLMLGIAGRLGYADLAAPYNVLSSNAGLVVLAVLLLIEVFADKVPGVDHINDVVNTVIRPAAGGVLFLSSSGAGTLNPALAALLGIITAGSIHATKATARPLVTATTAGLGNPVVSVIEDVLSFVAAFLAIVAPVLVIVFLLLLLALTFRLIRRLRAKRARSALRHALP
jgi:hypothetical protein